MFCGVCIDVKNNITYYYLMKYIQAILRGIGQVMFQNNSYSGALFLIGICYNSWLLGLAALMGAVVSTGFAQFLRYSKEDIQNGLYGFNGTLSGIAVFCFFKPNITAVVALFIGAALSTVVMHFLKKALPAFTAPFVLSTWAVMYSLVFVFNVPLMASLAPVESSFNLFTAASNSFGQVMFQENVVTGLFFLLAILINNRLMAAYAIYAAVLGSFVGWFTEQASAVNAGLMGYNAILCAIALVGRRKSDFLWISLAIVLSTWVNIGLGKTGIITLTAPFVIVTWGVLWVKKLVRA